MSNVSSLVQRQRINSDSNIKVKDICIYHNSKSTRNSNDHCSILKIKTALQICRRNAALAISCYVTFPAQRAGNLFLRFMFNVSIRL